MRKSRQIIMGSMAALLCIGVSGCGSNVSVSQNSNELLAQYAANAILQKNSEYEDRFEVTTQQEVTTQAQPDSEETVTTQESVQEQTDNKKPDKPTDNKKVLSDIFLSQKIDIQYKGYKVTTRYEDDNHSSLPVEASSGKKLLVLRFQIKNISGSVNKIDLLSSSLSYNLQIGSSTLQPLLTVLDDDLATYQDSLKANASKNVVLLFEIPKELGKSPQGTLEVSNGKEQGTTSIQ